ncbi:P2X purinoceptor 3a [Salarias fasciatus]|uniref:P2X purinoceptor 3a n=1 Tax=Salarias fasciatus TaxID=181472 RepID=UPI00117700DE|nr:P2X purinoceptor 3-like [Salarias fasciatus]
MGSMLWGCVTDFFTYETTKSVVVKSWSVGIINRIVQLLIIAYFVGWVFFYEKAYQVSDTGIESSVMTKVKGFGYHNNRVMDVADYVFPSQGTSVFCIMTKLIITEHQFQGRCPENGRKYSCFTDEDCHQHYGSILTNGVITGVCIKGSNGTKGRCEIEGWCPAENDQIHVDPMLDVKNFTIFIKNSIRFPLFDVTRGNFPSTMTSSQIRNCTYHPELNPFCPIFRVGDVLNYTGQSIEDLSAKGGEIGINIQWKCNLDLSIEKCVPEYAFTRLDAPFAKNAVSKGYNFRFAKYFMTENGTEFRTLHKAFAIRFDVMVTGTAGKFNTIPTLINLVAAFTSIGLGTVLCDYILLNFLKGAEQYKAKKFEEVSDAQITASAAQSPGSQLSLKEGIKSSYDSGALSLANSDQPL